MGINNSEVCMRKGSKKTMPFLFMAVVCCLSAFAGGRQGSTVSGSSGGGRYPAYLNIGNTYPIVKQGENVTLKILTATHPQFGGKTEDLFFWRWVDHKLNIKVSVEQVLTTAMPERKALLFASGDLPDLMFELGLTPVDLINYGQVEKQLYDIKKLLNPDLAPNLIKSFEKTPDAEILMTTPDDAIYSFPMIAYPNNLNTGFPKLFMNTQWLAKLGLGRPETLDDLYIVLKAFKEKDPSGTGRIIPLGGNFKNANPYHFILSAFGFAVTNSDPSAPALRNGKVEIPAGSPIYKDFLTYMNKLYTEGLMDTDFYTDDNNQSNAKLAEKRIGAWVNNVYATLPRLEDFSQYEALSPVTSSINSKKIVTKSPQVTIRDAMSGNTKYPEVGMRFMDYLYTEEACLYSWNGPTALHKDDTLGLLEGFMYSEDYIEQYPEVISGRYPTVYEFIERKISPFTGRHGDYSDLFNIFRIASGLPREEVRKYNVTYPDNQWRQSMYDWVTPYGVDGYPTIIYLSAQENTRLSDLQTVITAYVDQETAKFITGANSLNNFDRYLRELNVLGFKEYQDLYIKGYDIYLASKK
jgi:putative aldouronate transport system substrate-binding protein